MDEVVTKLEAGKQLSRLSFFPLNAVLEWAVCLLSLSLPLFNEKAKLAFD